MSKPRTDTQRLRLLRIIQRLKSLILTDLEPSKRDTIKKRMLQLDEMYTKGEISIDKYKFLALTFLMKDWEAARREQFLYKETGNFLTQAEKFAISEFSP